MPAPANSSRRIWLFRLAASTVVPALLLLLLESGLRIANVGYPTGFLVRIPGREAVTGNPRFGWRFFPRAQSRTPVMLNLPAVKSNNTVRIFLLGSSAALGMPEPAYGVARILEAMLRETFTNTQFEVVNAAMTAVNSHAVLPIARDCAKHAPDLFVIYEGNNEVVGPFGPGTVFQGYSPGLAGIRARLRTRSTRTGQAVQALVERIGRASQAPTEWRGMAMFLDHLVAEGDPRLDDVRRNFRRNLEDVIAVARKAGARVVVSTVAVNLLDSPPFASAHRAGFPAAGRAGWDESCRIAGGLEDAGETAAALEKYLELEKQDDRFAELQFRIARCAYALGRFEEAKRRFTRAMELDALRFRTDTALNQVIREVASGREGAGVHLADAAGHFESVSPEHHGIPGGEFFYDHVHFNFAGNYELARVLFARVAPLVQPGAARSVSPPSRDRCAGLLAFTVPDELAMEETISRLMCNPPFTAQLGYDRRRAAEAGRLASLRGRLTPAVHAAALAAHRDAAARHPDDPFHLNRLAQMLHESGDLSGALAMWKRLQALLPQEASFHVSAGRTLLAQRAAGGAYAEFEEALRDTVHPAEVCDAVAEEFLSRNDSARAETWYRRGLEAVPYHADLRNGLGCVFMRQQQYARALAEFRVATARSPEHARFRDNLGMTLLFLGRADEALGELRRAVALDPADSRIRDHLGYALVRSGRDAEGGEQFAIGLRMDPGNAELQNHYREFLRHQGRR